MFAILFLKTALSVPLQVTQNGRVLDPNGAPVEGLTPVTFRVFDAQTGGQVLWDETLSIPFSNG